MLDWLRRRKEFRRLTSLKKRGTCEGCGLKGPWLGIFVHPIMPVKVRGECKLADELEPMHKMARLMTLNMMGIPLDREIMKSIEKEMFDNPTEESMDFVNYMHSMLQEAGVLEEIDKPSRSASNSNTEDDENAWKQFD